MSNESKFCFADKSRGLWATQDGKLYITEPGTNKLIKSPLIFTAPYRILVSERYDPYAIILTSNGHLFIFDIKNHRVIMSDLLPVNTGVAETLEFNEDKSKIIMTTNHGVFTHNIPKGEETAESHWNIIEEPLEFLETNPDSKSYAQCARIEGEIAAAVEQKDFAAYAENIKKYFLFVATYLPNPTFIAAWYEIINSPKPFMDDQIKDLFTELIGLLSSVERVAPLIDELEMSLEKH